MERFNPGQGSLTPPHSASLHAGYLLIGPGDETKKWNVIEMVHQDRDAWL